MDKTKEQEITKTVNKKDIVEEEKSVELLDMDRILHLCGGVYEDTKTPKAGTTLALLSLGSQEEDCDIEKEADTTMASVEAFYSGGAIVYELSFKPSDIKDMETAYQLCEEYFTLKEEASKENKHLEKALIFNVIPLELGGELNILHNDLIYAMLNYDDKDALKLVLVFNYLEPYTDIYMDEDADYEQLLKEAEEAELEEIREMNEKIAEEALEVKELEKENTTNPYEKSVKDRMNTITVETEEEARKSGVRFSDEDEDEYSEETKEY